MVVDLHLPHVDGEALFRQIQANKQLAQCYVMLVTADDQLAHYMQNEASFVLLKPISFSQLHRLAQRLIQNPQLLAQQGCSNKQTAKKN